MAATDSPLFLLPVDGSAASLRAAKHCARLAKAFAASVLVLNVQPEVEEWQTHGLGHQAAIDHLKALATKAREGAERVLAEAGVAFEGLVAFGNAPETIARVVEERHCEAVVMGTRGTGELASFVLGGVGMKVIHLVRVPVTFVH